MIKLFACNLKHSLQVYINYWASEASPHIKILRDIAIYILYTSKEKNHFTKND